jgi:hypothetical protein
MTRQEGNGAAFFESLNFSLPLMNLISFALAQKLWKYFVSVLAGIKKTEVAVESKPLPTQFAMSLYGGLQNTTSLSQFLVSPILLHCKKLLAF